MKRLVQLLIAVALCQQTLLACPVCFQVAESPTTHGLQAAVIVLLGVTTTVLAGFGIFIVKFIRRA